MTQCFTPTSEDLQYYATAAYPCSYVEGRVARSQVVVPSVAIDDNKYSELVQHGFRRSGQFIYRPHCDHCHACTSMRLLAQDFQPNRSQKRAWAQHAHLTTTIVQPHFSAEHFELYARYQKVRHAGGGMDQDEAAQYIEFLVRSNVHSFMVEFRDQQAGDPAGELKMVSVIDQLNDGLSAVYTFYMPEARQSYGTFNVLWQLQQTRLLGLSYLYLGYWIDGCKKMSYKTHFKPHQFCVNDEWIQG